jgi:hypothetical protein
VRPRTVPEPIGRETSAVGCRYQATANDDASVDISVYVTVKYIVYSRAVSKSPVNPIINRNPVYSHSIKLSQYNCVIGLLDSV